MICVNCTAEISGKYCPNCGQRAGVKRITLREVWFDFWSKVYGFDGLFTRTLRDLTLRPGKVSNAYVSGNRVLYYGPVGYFFLTVTLLFIVLGVLGVNVADYVKAAADGMGVQQSRPGSGQAQLTESILLMASENLKWVSFIMVPVQAFCSRYLFFRKNSLNYLEHNVLPLYLQGHLYWLTIVEAVYYKTTGMVLPQAVSVLMLIYFGYAYANLNDYQSKVKSFFKGIGVAITAQLILMILLTIVLVILIIVFPEVREMVRPSNNR